MSLKEKLMSLPVEIVCEGFELLYQDKIDSKGLVHSSIQDTSTAAVPDFDNFASLIRHMKIHYAFPELDDFSIEGDFVVFRRGGRRIDISHEASLIEAMPSKEKKVSEDKSGGGRFSRLEF